MATRMQQRRGTASQWATANPVLAAGEIGLESDTVKFKIGDGVNVWSNLSYFENEDTAGSDFIENSEKGAEDGVATLDSTGNVPASQLGNAPDPDLSGYATKAHVDDLIGDGTVDGTAGNTVTDRINTAISNLIDNADVSLDTLNELANAINNDDDFSTTINNLIAGKQDAITGGATTITSSNLTANRALISNASGKVAVSPVTSTELSRLDGVTSSIQTQLDGKASSFHSHTSTQIEHLTGVIVAGDVIDTHRNRILVVDGGTSNTSLILNYNQFQDGDYIKFVNFGTGTVTFSVDGGSLYSYNNLDKMNGQYSVVTATRIANGFALEGDLR